MVYRVRVKSVYCDPADTCNRILIIEFVHH